jgi:FlaA1/EpsC-like NDP-sugar epimerase
VPLFQQQRTNGHVTITDPRMTRFWLTLEQGVRFVIRCINAMHGGEIFVPKIPSMKITELATLLAPGCEMKEVGIRPGEKLHEVLISEDEARHARELDDMYVVQPAHSWWDNSNWNGSRTLPEGFRYTSDGNPQWLSVEQMRKLIECA